VNSQGAQTLRARLEQQEHWRQAEAVRNGGQPAVDPDAWELEELGEGVRLYATREQHRRVVNGQDELVVERFTKRLVDGRWEISFEVEKARSL
jgi:uncharacterized caspase-like protein